MSAFILACTFVFAAPGGELPLDTLSAWTVVVAPDASPSEQYAAEEFRTLFQQATGKTLPVSNDIAVRQNAVLIGPGATGVPLDGLGEEELRISIRPDRVLITGGRPRGTLYGVYEFFERYFSCEFLTYDQTWFPPASDLKPLPVEDHAYTPPFSFRWSYYKENTDHPEFATRLRVNTVAKEERLGGKTPQNLIGHSYYKWINAEKYAKTHPEYFALVDGARIFEGAGGGPQPCPSNPEVLEIVAKGAIEEIEKNPGIRNVTVSQNDNGAYCRCPQCEEINTREGSPAAANLMLVNAVAERVEQVHPEVRVGTLAYWYTRKPPKSLRPRHNVQIQLCSIECCSLHPINDPGCPLNRSFCDDLTGWRALSDEIWIWNYNTNFSYYDLPFANFKSIGPNVKFFLDSHAKGVFMQSNGNGNAGEFCDLRNYVMAKCLWKPGLDSWALAERFCRLHYGAAADEIIDYLTMLHRVSEEAGFHPDCGPTPERIGLTPEIARDIVARFQRALDKAENDTVRARVEKASISAYKAVLLTAETAWRYQDGRVVREMPADTAAVLDKYLALCKTYNMTMHNEGTPLEKFLETFQAQAQVPATQIENDVWRVTVTPDHNGSVVGLFHKPSGHELLRAMRNFNIDKGILETYVQTGPYRRTHNMKCDVETTPEAIRCTKQLPDGSFEERVVRFIPGQPERLQVEFAITQRGDKPQDWRFTSQTGFHPGTRAKDADTLAVYARTDRWQVVNRGWLVDNGPDADVLKNARGGGVAFYNHDAKYGALIGFPPDEVGELALFWHPERPQLNVDVRTPKVTLQPGQTLRLHYTLEYLQSPPTD